MKRKAVSGIILTLLLMGVLTLAFNIQPFRAESGTIYVDDDNTWGPWYGTPAHPYQNITSALEHALVDEDPRFGEYCHDEACLRCPHDPRLDLNQDGVIDGLDLEIVDSNYEKTW